MKLLKNLNDSLVKEIKKNEEAISLINENEKMHLGKIRFFEDKQGTSVKENSSKGTQTLSWEAGIPCNLCIFVATCEEELS